MNIDRKRESFRMQIRRKGLEFDFKLKRKDETPVTPQQAVLITSHIVPNNKKHLPTAIGPNHLPITLPPDQKVQGSGAVYQQPAYFHHRLPHAHPVQSPTSLITRRYHTPLRSLNPYAFNLFG
jgi:hypothetical protein